MYVHSGTFVSMDSRGKKVLNNLINLHPGKLICHCLARMCAAWCYYQSELCWLAVSIDMMALNGDLSIVRALAPDRARPIITIVYCAISSRRQYKPQRHIKTDIHANRE